MTQEISLSIDGQLVTASSGEKILWVALRHGIFIPHLCAMETKELASAACRLCFVEVEGRSQPVTACTEAVQQNMVVNTRSKTIDALVKTGFELILSVHQPRCAQCARNGNCMLHAIAKARGLSLKPQSLSYLERDRPTAPIALHIEYAPQQCILCGCCVQACKSFGSGILGFCERGFERLVTTFPKNPPTLVDCDTCHFCVQACPVGALSVKKD